MRDPKDCAGECQFNVSEDIVENSKVKEKDVFDKPKKKKKAFFNREAARTKKVLNQAEKDRPKDGKAETNMQMLDRYRKARRILKK